MEQIQHKHVQVGELKLHVAEIGTGPKVVLFLHGFPEIWYSWRHQMLAVAAAGYRAIAPDARGYGLSDQPLEPEKTTFDDLVVDIIGLLDSLGINKVFVVGKDFGAFSAFQVAVMHPERVSGVITLGIPFMLPGQTIILNHPLPKGFYVVRWQDPARAEADFARFDIKTVVRKIYTLFCRSELQVAEDDQEIMDLVDPSTPLPSFFSEEDLQVYATLYENSGFRTAMMVPYRTLGKDCGITNPKITAPSQLIMGEKDYVMKFHGYEDYIRGGKVKDYVPDLDVNFIPEGNHFVQEQLPEQVNQLIISFLDKHSTK